MWLHSAANNPKIIHKFFLHFALDAYRAAFTFQEETAGAGPAQNKNLSSVLIELKGVCYDILPLLTRT